MNSKKSGPGDKYHHGDMRKALIQGALDLVAESGVASLSLRELARRIGVSTAAPYFHFKDRQSLLIEIAIDGYRELYRQLEAAEKNAASTEAELSHSAAAYLRFTKSHRAHYAIMFSGQFGGHERFDEMVAAANESLALVGASIARSSRMDRNLVVQASFCAWCLLHGIAMLDQNGVLFESAAEQEALGVQGVTSMMKGFNDQLPQGEAR